MMYTIEVVKEIVHQAEIEGITVKEALQKIADGDVDWDVPDYVDDEGPTAIIGVSQDGNTFKQNADLLKEAKKVWKEIAR